MSTHYNSLKRLLKELFLLDQPDLDFGLYRIMQTRSKELLGYLEKDLPMTVKEALKGFIPLDKYDLGKKIEESIKNAKELGVDPEELPKIKELRAEYNSLAIDLDSLESDIYNDLYRFFSRYYDSGDFISKRVYKEGVYAIPYNGEEVKLYWANQDQYYIKTCEYFKDYSFKLAPNSEDMPMRVHFKICDVQEGAHNNNLNRNKRVFILNKEEPFKIENNELTFYFEYREANLNDRITPGVMANPPSQTDLIKMAEEVILEKKTEYEPYVLNDKDEKHINFKYFNLLSEKYKKSDGTDADYTVFKGYLNRFCGKNTFDYFIHKNLKKFLLQELDFFIKNEVMHLDDIESESAPKVEVYLSKIKILRQIAKQIIIFLSQLEDFQKKLWMKKKFVVETNYCITLDRIPESFYNEIINNQAQINEWIDLFSIDKITKDSMPIFNADNDEFSKPLTEKFLKENLFLVLDTKNFSEDFKHRLISHFDNLDEMINGLLIHGENFQALNLISNAYSERVDCIYIDPPYNSDSAPIAYKNNYKDSSWNTLISNRLDISKILLSENGINITAIDDIELRYLICILDNAFGKENFISCITTLCNPQGRVADNVSKTSEYHLVYAKEKVNLNGLYVKKISNRSEWVPFKRTGTNSRREERPLRFYPVFQKSGSLQLPTREEYGKIFKDQGHFNENYIAELTEKYTDNGFEVIWPQKADGTFLVWQREFNRAQREIGTYQYRNGVISTPGFEEENPKTCWIDPIYANPEYGTELLRGIVDNKRLSENTAKSVYTVQQAISMNSPQIVLDYFAGSGTTGHAVINLNREDDGNRKFILIEMGDYFDTVLKQRVIKNIYCDLWRDLLPVNRNSGLSHCFKYIRLESYEDTLNNIELKKRISEDGTLPFEHSSDFQSQYLLQYMLYKESADSQSLLNIDEFYDPSKYSMKIKIAGSDETKDVFVDMIETFNYLLGLSVTSISAPQYLNAATEQDSEGRLVLNGRLREEESGKWWFRTVTGVDRADKKVLIIWRNRPGKEDPAYINEDNLILDEWFKKQGYSSKDSEFDLIYVNGSNNLENLKVSDEQWKVRLTEEAFKELMFENSDR